VHVVLETERLILRRVAEDDVDALLALDSDAEVMAFIDTGPPPTRERMTARVRDWIEDYTRYGGLGRYVAVARDSGAFLGWISLRSDGGDEVDLGYRLVRSAWGHGYATEGARALVDAAFQRYGLSRVYATTMYVNRRSRAVMERAGLRWVGTFHLHFDDPIPGTELGEVEYAITRSEWEDARGVR
jgi:RimJ/RimL family protein N-acetyltransferase